MTRLRQKRDKLGDRVWIIGIDWPKIGTYTSCVGTIIDIDICCVEVEGEEKTMSDDGTK